MMNTHQITLTALRHYSVCPRQCALVYNEQVWADNFFTASGQQLHERVDSGEIETRKGIRYERGVLVNAPILGITGKLDLLEIDLKTGALCPVEYKRGKPKKDDWDKIQLCAQALCLEEMRNQSIEKAALWYGLTRHRLEVDLDVALRDKTIGIIESVKAMFITGITPRAVFSKICKSCSLIDLCQPKKMSKDLSSQYVARLFESPTDEEAS